MKPVAVLGAGIAGLTAALELQKRGVPTVVFEAGKSVGGMASSFKDKNGFSYDLGAHFVSNRLARALGAEKICRPVKHYGEAVAVKDKTYSYPFGLLASPRFAGSALAARLRRTEINSAADHFRSEYGSALADEVAIPLAEAWSGVSADNLSPAVGAKMQSGPLKTLYLKAASRVLGRAVCIGYSHEMPEGAGVQIVYPEGGLSKLLEPTLNKVRHGLRLESPVEKVLVNGGRVEAVRVNGQEIGVSAVVSTAPVNVLPKLIDGTDALDHLGAFRYRPMIFVNLCFEGRNLLPDTMLWVPDRSQPFFRVTETPISMPWLAPEGKTIITFDIGCERGDHYWTMTDEQLAKLCLDGFCRLFPEAREKFISAGGIVKTPVSYPVYHKNYELQRQRFAQSSGIDGLYSIGRNGEFAHILMEDIYWRTCKRMGEVAAYVGSVRRAPTAGLGAPRQREAAAALGPLPVAA